ncbi:hypothetical protein Ddc_10673 [Ditylenchus destructor]|nr:hypothetical protein Ddc_10673 [Ditylenchus destructor]
MVVPLFVMLPQSAANCFVETTTPVSVETTTPVSATNVSVSATNVSVSATNVSVSATNVSVGNDSLADSETMGDYGKETELNEVLLAGLIGEAHFLEGFAPGVHMFIQKGALSFEDIGSWVERIETNTENDTK